MGTTTDAVKKLFKNNFTNLFNGELIELNQATIKIMASYEDMDGGFCDPELILDAYNNKFDEESLKTMLNDIEEDYLEVDYKKENDDYIITAGNNEAVYVIRLQVIRIK